MNFKLFERIDIPSSSTNNEFDEPWPDEPWSKEKVNDYFDSLVNTTFYRADYHSVSIDEHIIALFDSDKHEIDIIAIDEDQVPTAASVKDLVKHLENNWQ